MDDGRRLTDRFGVEGAARNAAAAIEARRDADQRVSELLARLGLPDDATGRDAA